MAVSIVS